VYLKFTACIIYKYRPWRSWFIC